MAIEIKETTGWMIFTKKGRAVRDGICNRSITIFPNRKAALEYAHESDIISRVEVSALGKSHVCE